MDWLSLSILLFLGVLTTVKSKTSGSDTDNTTVTVTTGSKNTLIEKFIEQEKGSTDLFARPGASLSLVSLFWESIGRSQYESKVQLVVTNFSKWPMIQVFSKIIKGQLNQLPNLIGPGLKEYALAWQDEFWSSSEGLITWAINGTSLKYCMVYWRVENSERHRRCRNRFGIGCFISRSKAMDVSLKIAEESESDAQNSAVADNLDWTYSHKDSISLVHCTEEFCIQGLFSPNVQSLMHISLTPLLAKDWKASNGIKQYEIELLKNSTHIEINQQFGCDTNYRVVKIIVLACALLMVKIILLVCYLSRCLCPGKASQFTVKYLRCYTKYNWMYKCLLQNYEITVLARNDEGEFVEREENGIAYYKIKALPYALYLNKSCDEEFGAGELLIGQKGPVIRTGRLSQQEYFFKLFTPEQLQQVFSSSLVLALSHLPATQSRQHVGYTSNVTFYYFTKAEMNGTDESEGASDPLVKSQLMMSSSSQTTNSVGDDSVELTVLNTN